MDNMKKPSINQQEVQILHEEKLKFYFLAFIMSYIAAWALIMNSPEEIIKGLYKIMTSPAGLLTDYFMLANPGAALMNSAIMTFLSLALIKKLKVKISGLIMAAVLMVMAFSLFGKNPFNALPILSGVLLHAKLKKEPFSVFIAPALFSTALGPLVSEIAFNMGLPLAKGLFLGSFAGLAAGLLIPIVAVSAMEFHKGYNLYNLGFTAGIIGTFLVSIARGFGAAPIFDSQIAAGYNKEMAIMLYSLFFIMIYLGLKFNRWNIRGIDKLFQLPGIAGTDFIATSGIGLTIINMGLLGCITATYTLMVGGELNGPTLGGILTVVAFGGFGKHVKNVLPVMAGVWLMAMIGEYEVNNTGVLLAATLGTTLAPIAGAYGKIAGVIVGMIHLNIVMYTGYLHAGLNLYNHGFAGGIVAGIMILVFEFTKQSKKNFTTKVMEALDETAV